jgi:hypothetical protein
VDICFFIKGFKVIIEKESEYLLLQELICMEDRIVAAMIELVCFPTSYKPSKHFDEIVTLLEQTEDNEEFCIKAKDYIKKIGAKFSISESVLHESFDLVKEKFLSIGIMIENIDLSQGAPVVLLNARDI